MKLLETRLRKLEQRASRKSSYTVLSPGPMISKRENESDEFFICRLADDEETLRNVRMTRSEFIETCRQVLLVI